MSRGAVQGVPDGAMGLAQRAQPAEAEKAPTRLLEAQDVSLTYKTRSGSIDALRNFRLSVRSGEFVAILGPSGCGKSTLQKLIAGLLPCTSGRITLMGTPVVGPRADIGVVFQTPSLMPWKSVLQNVLVASQSLQLDKARSQEYALQLLELVGLGRFVDNYPHELSGGMQQRVGLVRGLVHDPAILLMDEPFAALDAMTRERMQFELQDLWLRTEKSVIFITHSIPEAVFLADRVIVMSPRPGRVIEEISVQIARPRGFETMAGRQFVELCSGLRQLFGQSPETKVRALWGD